MKRGIIDTFSLREKIQWLDYNITKLDDSSQIMKNMLDELRSEDFERFHIQPMLQLREELDELLCPCLDRIDHAKYLLNKMSFYFKKLDDITNAPGPLPKD